MNSKRSLSLRFLVKMPKFLVSDPYETFFAIALVLAGLVDIVDPTASGAVGRLLPTWQTVIWGVALVLGGSATFIGLLGSSSSSSLSAARNFRELERTGQLMLTISTLLWSIVLFSVGPPGIVSGILTLFLSLVTLVKAAVLKGIEEYVTGIKNQIKGTKDD